MSGCGARDSRGAFIEMGCAGLGIATVPPSMLTTTSATGGIGVATSLGCIVGATPSEPLRGWIHRMDPGGNSVSVESMGARIT